MTIFRLRHVDTIRGRDGKRRFYFRRGHGPRTPLPSDPHSPEFRAAYQAALRQSDEVIEKPSFAPEGTFNWLLERYFQSMAYAKLAKSTKYASRLAMERYIRDENLGHRKFRDVRLQHIETMMTKRTSTPGAANDLLKKMRVLYKFAIKNGWAANDPTVGAGKFQGGEFHTWTEEEIETFEATYPVGTRERTAFALLLYTGQRLADVTEMVWTDIIDGKSIRVQQNKTRTKLDIRLHRDLQVILQEWPRQHISILTTTYGKPFTHKGFGNWMADRISRANLPERCVTHGLRKAAARRLAEAGCSTKEIMAVTGHQTSQMVDHYTKASDQVQMARDAMERLERRTLNKSSQT